MNTQTQRFGSDLFGEGVYNPKSTLGSRFIIPPTTCLGRTGEWMERKRIWLSLGIEGSAGRGQDVLYGNQERLNEMLGTDTYAGVSVFDPVLCEVLIAWYSARNDLILNPFAGESVPGIVAGVTERRYRGFDVRPEQVVANQQQARAIWERLKYEQRQPEWEHLVNGSRDLDWWHQQYSTAGGVRDTYDFIFSCPPYGDLEVYSDDPNDISTMPYLKFLEAYRDIIKKACALLAPDRFACFVVGNYRDPKGHLIDLEGDTVRAFQDAGLAYYNDCIFVTPMGTVPMRTSHTFNSGRKLGRTHQYALVFVKGDWRKAAARLQ